MTMRFLPWTRRGLAAELDAVDGGGALPARASFPVRLTVNGSQARTDIVTYGPGDVTGIDIEAIVRSAPGRFAQNVAPDEMAAIEFDPPDFPWLFTPAVAAAHNRLRPWLVLVVVAKTDGVSIAVSQSRPAPVLTIEAPAVPADELPDLSESWAWAHTQVISSSSTPLLDDLTERPDNTVSRLLCPRRLRESTAYYAALVPAFDAGRAAGLGQDVADATLGPAWDRATVGTRVELPVYYHWEFTTGRAGDFESLARRLTPRPLPPTVGSAPMFIGAAHPALPGLAPDAGGIVAMEGALRAPGTGSGAGLDARHNQFVEKLVELVDSTADAASGGTASDAEAVAPPIHGQWQADVHQIPDAGARPRWLRELNADPRHRAAAGLGAEVVRANQEAYVDAAWAQVGDVLAANRLLDIARAMSTVVTRVHHKHVAGADPVTALVLTRGAHARLPMGSSSLRALIERSATPHGFASPAFQRMASPRGSHLRVAARRGAKLTAAGNVDTSSLARATQGAFAPAVGTTPDGVRDTALARVLTSGSFDMEPGVRTDVEKMAGSLGKLVDTLDAAPRASVEVRPDLGRTGVFVDRHLAAIRATAGDLDDLTDRIDRVRDVVRSPIARGVAEPVVGFLLADDVTPLTLDRDGAIHVRAGDRIGTLRSAVPIEEPSMTPASAREAIRRTVDSPSARMRPLAPLGPRLPGPVVRPQPTPV
ncbi:MAG: hypothetical protein JJE52_15440, partial [Acidimicrobiia bacterium]|nr:hypothetical protein [Acidimicrobiia bacterium]